MIYLTNGNMPLNAAYADEIVQEENSTYQLSFRFPTSDPLWEKLKEETFLTADDLHGEQDFVIFEVEKKHGYIQVYANQVFTLLNNYVVNPISLDRQTGSTALSRFAGSITRDNPFSFFSDIEDRHTFNIGSKNAMEAFAKDKHSIIGQWGGDLVRHGYQVRLLKKGGSENESLFMYKKNLSSYQHKPSTKSLKTRITFIATVKGEGEKAPDRTFTVTIDSPLINKYSQIYEDVIEVNDQDVKDEASLRKYGEQYYRTSLCDMMEDSLEIEVVGQSDVPVQMFDVVSIFHERYNLDVRKKITKYTYSPMAKKLKSIGFGQFQSGLANAIGNAVSDAVKGEAQQLQGDFERQLARELKNADLASDRKTEELQNEFTDGLNAAKTRAEEVKRELSDIIDQRFSSFDNGPLQEVKRRVEEALRNAGASSLLAQEAKRIGLDSVAKLEEFKRQATSAQTALSGDLDILKRTIASDILSKQAQAEAEIAKQVEALVQTKKELAGVKSAQATYEETTTRRLSELTNLADGKASKSELTQTAEELKSRIASVQVGGTNLYGLSKNSDIWKGGHVADFKMDISSGEISFKATGLDPYVGEATTHPRTASSRNGVRIPVIAGKSIYVTISNPIFAKNFISYFDENGNTVKHYQYYNTNSFVISPKELTGVSFVSLRFGCVGSIFEIGDVLKTKVKVEYGTIPTNWSPAPEDVENQISVIESNFKQRADSLEAGVSRLTEGLKTKADSSALTLLSDSIKQSVKSLETDTDNKFAQKLSTTEFEVQVSGIRQEIVNATKDKADKTLVTAEAGRLREELASLSVGGRNLLKGSKGPFKPNRNPANFDNNTLYSQETLVYLVQNEKYRISAKSDGNFTSWHSPNNENDNVVLWLMDKAVSNYQIVSDAKTATTGTEFVWNRPTGIYHLRVNTYRKDPQKLKSVWEVKVEQGSFKTGWSPAPEDVDGLITEAKATFERTAQGLRTDLSAIQEYVNKDGQRQEALQRYSREESAKQATAVRELVARDYVGKSTYQEDVRGLERRFEAITNPQNGTIATQIANYKTAVDGRFTDITSLLSSKVNQTDFQRVKETSQLYERTIGSNENDISNKVARMALTNQLFQVEVAKITGRNLIRNYDWDKWLPLSSFSVGWKFERVEDQFSKSGYMLKATCTKAGNGGFHKVLFDLRPDELQGKDMTWSWDMKSSRPITFYGMGFEAGGLKRNVPVSTEWKRISNTFKVTFKQYHSCVFYANDWKVGDVVYIRDPQLEEGTIATSPKRAPEDTDEAIRTVQSQLSGSWAVQNITSAGDLISGINLGANGHNRFVGKLTHITGETLIDNAVIKSAMVDKLKTANFEAGSVTTVVLDAEAVTAEKVRFDDAFINRITAKNALIEGIISKQAFINHLNSLTFEADRITGGNLSATNGAMKIDLNKGQYEVYTEEAAMRRVVAGYPNQFIKFTTGKQEIDSGREMKSGVTVIGSNSDGTENGNNQTFAGLQIWNNPNQRNVSSIGDYLKVSNKGYGENEKGWIIQTSDTPTIAPIRDNGKPETGKRSAILSGDFYFINKWGQKVSLLGILERFIVNFNTLRDKRGILYTDFSELN